MTRRPTILLGLPLAAALALAACGGGASPAPATGGPGDSPASSVPAGDPTATSVPEETAAPAAAGPIDACALLTADEVATLVSQPSPEAETRDAGPLPSYACTWRAGASDAMIPVSLAVTATPGFLSSSGATLDFARTMIEAEGRDPENNGRVVDGLGDAASVTSVVRFDSTVQFLQGDTLVEVALTADDAPAKQDAVVELARAVAGRLP